MSEIFLGGRLNENTSSKENIEFINQKLQSGKTKAEIIRNAINVYRLYEEGKLNNTIMEELKKIQNTLDNIKTSNVVIDSTDKEENISENLDSVKQSLNNIVKNGI